MTAKKETGRYLSGQVQSITEFLDALVPLVTGRLIKTIDPVRPLIFFVIPSLKQRHRQEQAGGCRKKKSIPPDTTAAASQRLRAGPDLLNAAPQTMEIYLERHFFYLPLAFIIRLKKRGNHAPVS